MTPYADKKIREALQLASGDKEKTELILATLIQNDVQLLKELTAKHMRGIIGYNIERVTGTKKASQKLAQTRKRSAKKAVSNSFGMKMLKAAAGTQAGVFGFDDGVHHKPQAASQKHIDAIHAIVAGGRGRRG